MKMHNTIGLHERKSSVLYRYLHRKYYFHVFLLEAVLIQCMVGSDIWLFYVTNRTDSRNTCHQFHHYGIIFRANFPCLFGCNFIFYPQNHKNKFLLNGILPDHYTLRISTELAYGKYVFLVLKVALRNHINFDAYFEPLSNNYKTL